MSALIRYGHDVVGISHRAGLLDDMRKLMCDLSIKAFEPVLVVTRNKIMSPKNEQNMSPLSIGELSP